MFDESDVKFVVEGYLDEVKLQMPSKNTVLASFHKTASRGVFASSACLGRSVGGKAVRQNGESC